MASTSITTAFVKQYGKTLDLLAQTKGGKFAGTCLEESIEGEEKYYDQLGSVIAQEVTDRYADSPENDITHARRRVSATSYDVGLMLDKFDKVQMLVNPESEYVQQQVTALNRKRDQEFIKGALGNAATGKTGGTLVSLPASSKVGAAAATISTSLLADVKQKWQDSGIDLDDPLNKAYIAVSPKVLNDLVQITQVTSSDYNTVKSLVKGDINTWYGFEFIVSNHLPYINSADNVAKLDWGTNDTPQAIGSGTADLRACIAWVKSGVRQVTNPSIMTEISKRDDKRFNYYAYSCMRTGAVRMEEEKVIQVLCDESP